MMFEHIFKRTEQFCQPRALKREVCDANFVLDSLFVFLTGLLQQGLYELNCLGSSTACRRLSVATAGRRRQAVANACTSGDAGAVETSSRAQWPFR